MSARLPKILRRRDAEQRRVDSFVAAIRATAPRPVLPPVPTTVPFPRVEPVETPRGIVWRLDAASRARLRPATLEPETNELPLSLVRIMVQP